MQRSRYAILIGSIIILLTLVANVVIISLNQQQQVIAQLSSSPMTKDGVGYSLVDIYEIVNKSVVHITSKVSDSSQSPEMQNATELGSGFIYDNQGHVITASHVIGGAKFVDVTFVDGSRYTAKMIGSDSLSDIAVLQIIENVLQPLKPLLIENSSKVRVGEQVVAIGHPFGIANTMTSGIIAQTGYLLSIPNVGVFFPDVIQSDAAINPGNSGGPLLNTRAQVIGLTIGRVISIGAPGPYPGLTVSTPSTALLRIVPALIANGNYSHPYVGLEGTTLTSDLAATINNLPRDFKGILVNSIIRNSPADKAGIEGSIVDKYDKRHWGDIITAVDGHAIIRNEDLISYVEQHKSVGQNVKLTIYRNGEYMTLDTTLVARPPTAIPNLQNTLNPLL